MLGLLVILVGCEGTLDGPRPLSPQESTPPPAAPGTPPVCDGITTAIAVPLRRLTPAEYQQALVDLFGSGVPDVSAVYPDGATGVPYSTFGSAQLVGDQQLRLLADAADAVAVALQPTLTSCNSGDFATCAQGRLQAWARIAFRRAPLPDDVTRLTSVATDALADGFSKSEALATAVSALLQHPAFLYVIESTPDTTPWSLDTSAQEARLALTLGGRLPDAQGRTDATLTSLSTPDGRATELARWNSLGGQQRFRAFVYEWLGLRTLPTVHEPAVRDALVEELNRLIDDAFTSDDVLATLLGSSTVYADRTLEGFYGLTAQSSGVGQFVKRTATWRVGVLTHPLVMAKTGHQQDSSVILRGRLLYFNVLCSSLGTPPGNALSIESGLPPASTPRARYEARAKNAACQGCHQFLDPLGFGFESYDGQGRYRTQAYGAPVDDLGTIRLGGSALDGDFTGPRELVDRLLANDWSRRCFATQWVRSTYGVLEKNQQGLTSLACTADRLGTALNNGRSLEAMLDAWVRDASFTQRQPETSP